MKKLLRGTSRIVNETLWTDEARARWFRLPPGVHKILPPGDFALVPLQLDAAQQASDLLTTCHADPSALVAYETTLEALIAEVEPRVQEATQPLSGVLNAAFAELEQAAREAQAAAGDGTPAPPDMDLLQERLLQALLHQIGVAPHAIKVADVLRRQEEATEFMQSDITTANANPEADREEASENPVPPPTVNIDYILAAFDSRAKH